MMRKVLVAALVTTLLISVSPFALATHKGSHKRKDQPCASGSQGWDIIGGGGTYSGPTLLKSTGTLHFEMTMAGPSCTDVNYNFFVLDGPGPDGFKETVLYHQDDLGDGTTTTYRYDQEIANDDDGTICVYHTATTLDGSVTHDRAPDSGCLDPATGQTHPSSGGSYN